MSYNNNFNDNLEIQDNDDEYIQNNQEQKKVSYKDDEKNDEKKLYERIFVFGNFFGLVPKGFEKYFNLFAFQLTSVIAFAIIYRILMIDFYKNFVIPKDFDHEHFINHKGMIALFMSINFQSTVAYVDLKCKSFLTRLVIILQIIATFAITFLFFF
jgi:hypothetical protein